MHAFFDVSPTAMKNRCIQKKRGNIIKFRICELVKAERKAIPCFWIKAIALNWLDGNVSTLFFIIMTLLSINGGRMFDFNVGLANRSKPFACSSIIKSMQVLV